MARNNYQDFVELNVSTCGATDATAEVLTAVGNSQPEGNLVRRLEISLIRREDRPATATRATPACETFELSIGTTVGQELNRLAPGSLLSSSPS